MGVYRRTDADHVLDVTRHRWKRLRQDTGVQRSHKWREKSSPRGKCSWPELDGWGSPHPTPAAHGAGTRDGVSGEA